jgi:putative transposase
MDDLFEAPVLLIGKRVLLLYHEHTPEEVEVFWNQKSYGRLTPVDLHVNCRVKRDRSRNMLVESSPREPYKGGGLWK